MDIDLMDEIQMLLAFLKQENAREKGWVFK